MRAAATNRIFQALGDPTRRAIFERLSRRGEAAVKDLAAGFSVSQPAVSQHLAALRSAGLVESRRTGRNSFYRVRRAGLRPLVSWIDRYEIFWRERLAHINEVLEELE